MDPLYFWGQASLFSNMAEAALTLANTRNIFSMEWETGWEKLEDTESEGIFTYDRYLNRFFSISTALICWPKGTILRRLGGIGLSLSFAAQPGVSSVGRYGRGRTVQPGEIL